MSPLHEFEIKELQFDFVWDGEFLKMQPRSLDFLFTATKLQMP